MNKHWYIHTYTLTYTHIHKCNACVHTLWISQTSKLVKVAIGCEISHKNTQKCKIYETSYCKYFAYNLEMFKKFHHVVDNPIVRHSGTLEIPQHNEWSRQYLDCQLRKTWN